MGPNGRPRMNFADDSKPDKKIARIMYSMTQQINKDTYQQGHGPGPGRHGLARDLRNLPSRSRDARRIRGSARGAPGRAGRRSGAACPSGAPPQLRSRRDRASKVAPVYRSALRAAFARPVQNYTSRYAAVHGNSSGRCGGARAQTVVARLRSSNGPTAADCAGPQPDSWHITLQFLGNTTPEQ